MVIKVATIYSTFVDTFLYFATKGELWICRTSGRTSRSIGEELPKLESRWQAVLWQSHGYGMTTRAQKHERCESISSFLSCKTYLQSIGGVSMSYWRPARNLVERP